MTEVVQWKSKLSVGSAKHGFPLDYHTIQLT